MKKYIVGILLIAYASFTYALISISGQTWVFYTLNGTIVNTSKYQDEKPSIVFDAGGRFSAYAGCNRIGGSYTISGQELTFSPNTIMTKMACPGNEALENNFIAILPQIRHWRLENSTLTLYSSAGAALLVLKIDTSYSN